jgi:hypothetical protein
LPTVTRPPFLSRKLYRRESFCLVVVRLSAGEAEGYLGQGCAYEIACRDVACGWTAGGAARIPPLWERMMILLEYRLVEVVEHIGDRRDFV